MSDEKEYKPMQTQPSKAQGRFERWLSLVLAHATAAEKSQQQSQSAHAVGCRTHNTGCDGDCDCREEPQQ